MILEAGVSPSKPAVVPGTGLVPPINMLESNEGTKALLEEWIAREKADGKAWEDSEIGQATIRKDEEVRAEQKRKAREQMETPPAKKTATAKTDQTAPKKKKKDAAAKDATRESAELDGLDTAFKGKKDEL